MVVVGCKVLACVVVITGNKVAAETLLIVDRVVVPTVNEEEKQTKR